MDTNLLSAAGAAGVAGLFTYIVARYNARISNEAALIGMPLPIIAEQNKRIGELTIEIDRLWKDLRISHDAEQKCRDDLREIRHENRQIKQRLVGLEEQLAKMKRDKNV